MRSARAARSGGAGIERRRIARPAMRAARANGALFYPINPGHEEESWQQFCEEAMHKFLSLEFKGDYEAKLIQEFEKFMPETPPWQKG